MMMKQCKHELYKLIDKIVSFPLAQLSPGRFFRVLRL